VCLSTVSFIPAALKIRSPARQGACNLQLIPLHPA
jgi:hypothetical protein